MRSLPAREIKRRGISAVDELLKEGAVYVIKNDAPRYVILDPDLYAELVDGYKESQLAVVRESLDDIRAGRVKEVPPEEMIAELVESQHEAFLVGVKESLEDYRAGRVRSGTAEETVRELHLAD